MAWTGRTRGLGYMLTSTTFFTGMAALSKAIGGRASTQEKIFWRSLLSVLFSAAAACTGAAAGGAGLPPAPKRPALLLLRGACGHTALLAYLEAIERLPLAEAVFLGKIHPLAAALLSWLFLGERLEPARALAILASLAGVALIARPSPEALASGSLVGASLGALAGVLSGAAYCCVRGLGTAGEAELWRMLSFPLVSITFCARAVLSEGGAGAAGEARELSTWLLFLAMGLVTQAGQLTLTRGLALLPAASGTQVTYFGSVLGVLFGVMLGDAWPPWTTWAGGGLIFASLLLAEVAERRPKRA